MADSHPYREEKADVNYKAVLSEVLSNLLNSKYTFLLC